MGDTEGQQVTVRGQHNQARSSSPESQEQARSKPVSAQVWGSQNDQSAIVLSNILVVLTEGQEPMVLQG